jgi:hypothetical protein
VGERVSAGEAGTIAAISRTSEMEEEGQREAVYEKNRPAIQYKLRFEMSSLLNLNYIYLQ